MSQLLRHSPDAAYCCYCNRSPTCPVIKLKDKIGSNDKNNEDIILLNDEE